MYPEEKILAYFPLFIAFTALQCIMKSVTLP